MASVAMVPFAAGRFSRMADCPICAWSCFAIPRATESGAPAANGTTMVTRRPGYDCPHAAVHQMADSRTPDRRPATLMRMSDAFPMISQRVDRQAAGGGESQVRECLRWEEITREQKL